MLDRKDLTLSADFWRVPNPAPYYDKAGHTVIDNIYTVLHTVLILNELYENIKSLKLNECCYFSWNLIKSRLVSSYSQQ